MRECQGSAKTRRESTEDLQCTLSDFRTGNSKFDDLHDHCIGLRDGVTSLLKKLADRGINIFDQAYDEIPGSNPKRYRTAYDGLCDAQLTQMYDDLLRRVPGITYGLAVDNSGYAPAHIGALSNAPTGDYAIDLAKCRHKRIFNDPVGIKQAQGLTAKFQFVLRFQARHRPRYRDLGPDRAFQLIRNLKFDVQSNWHCRDILRAAER